MNQSNKIIIPLKYEQLTPYVNNMAKVKLGSLYGYINTSGKVVLPIIYKSLSNIIDNRFYAVDKSNVNYIMDTTGRIILKGKAGIFID